MWTSGQSPSWTDRAPGCSLFRSSLNPNPPIVSDGKYIRGLKTLGFMGPPEYVNGSMQLLTQKSVVISISEWTRLFTLCFNVENPETFDGDQPVSFIKWDLKEYPEEGSYLPGSEGVVITLVTLFPHQSKPAGEKILYEKWLSLKNPGMKPGLWTRIDHYRSIRLRDTEVGGLYPKVNTIFTGKWQKDDMNSFKFIDLGCKFPWNLFLN